MNNVLIPADTNQLQEYVVELLEAHKLPTSDLDDHKHLFMLQDQKNEITACGGLEFFQDKALLRSVAVRKELRGTGLGKRIVNALEQEAKAKGVKELYLLTTTARPFFEKTGYTVISRSEAPDAIRSTAEFSSLCPSSAIVMIKKLL